MVSRVQHQGGVELLHDRGAGDLAPDLELVPTMHRHSHVTAKLREIGLACPGTGLTQWQAGRLEAERWKRPRLDHAHIDQLDRGLRVGVTIDPPMRRVEGITIGGERSGRDRALHRNLEGVGLAHVACVGRARGRGFIRRSLVGLHASCYLGLEVEEGRLEAFRPRTVEANGDRQHLIVFDCGHHQPEGGQHPGNRWHHHRRDRELRGEAAAVNRTGSAE